MTIADPRLRIETIDGHPGERRIVVTYSIHVPPFDPAVGQTLLDEAVVSALDEHDAPVGPSPLEVHLHGRVDGRPGVIERELETQVHRADLDVERDWWRIDGGGRFEPIAEFVDHLVAEIFVRVGDECVATTTTPPLTGSWGALGKD